MKGMVFTILSFLYPYRITRFSISPHQNDIFNAFGNFQLISSKCNNFCLQLQVIHCRGYLKIKQQNVGGDLQGSFEPGFANVGFVGVANSLPPSSITEVKMHSSVFMFRASLDLKLIFLDQQVSPLTG